MSRLDLKISEIYGVSLSDTGSMRSSEAAHPGVAISLCFYSALTHPHSDPTTTLATATNEQVKHSVELGILGPALFMVQQREEKVVNIVYMLRVNTYSCQPFIVVAVLKPTSCPGNPKKSPGSKNSVRKNTHNLVLLPP